MHAKQTIKDCKPFLKVIEFCCTYNRISISLWPSWWIISEKY